jgi:ribosomal protein S18 acetylase RimI-like enzyme
VHSLTKLLLANTPKYFHPSEAEDFERYLNDEVEQYFVVIHFGNVIGAGGINFKGNKGYISWDLIHPEHQGKSVGTNLLNHRLTILKKMSIKTVVVRTSQMAFGFYEKHGFQLVQSEKDYWSEGFDLYEMELELI